ncbi:acyl carrier protein [Actinokineospora cianjurensis]|uniref:Acyl carrier protein n=1 Tax=Actinokineospora cianjurensis TaxID=585224 RepID=A0A421AX39_9PSEU|nr:acyl carrier protein [Actinokineospora cianjurensis]RLK54393.1 acyl carrier protein [Actinokineospora cianjurensis]
MALFEEVAGILREVVGPCGGCPPEITPNATLEGDLRFDSLDLVRVDAALSAHLGAEVGLAEHVRGLDLDAISTFTVEQVVDRVRDGAARA